MTASARRRTPRRRALRAGTTVLLLTATALAAGPAAAGGPAAGGGSGEKPTVVLVHGAFADASGWDDVTGRLQRDGYEVVAPANPLRGLGNDSTYLASVLRSIEGPIVLVGHSYGGAVISGAAAGNPRVKALVYVAAFMPDKGESLAELSAKFSGSELDPALRPVPYTDATGSGTDLYIRNDRFHDVFAADLPRERTRVMAAAQRPAAAAGFAEKATAAAWKTIPSWFLVARQDKAIAPDLERFEARRAKSRTVEIDSSHVAMMSHPDAVARLIRQAAKATR
ncbi:alpha/beta fold hydrolase [Streptomyces cinereoruber]|uniref:alpha/beta fold hydrolase n=1 Tax=Streptomyces cinereoruber TaxID=67260 RepID=UPI003EB74CA3